MEESPARRTQSLREMERIGMQVRLTRQALRKMGKCPRDEEGGEDDGIRRCRCKTRISKERTLNSGEKSKSRRGLSGEGKIFLKLPTSIPHPSPSLAASNSDSKICNR